MKPKFAAPLAVMNMDDGEEIAGMWSTPHIPQIGIYKLLAKKKKDGTVEWAHFVQRNDGRKENVYRGTVEDAARLADVLQALNNALRTTYGPAVSLKAAEAEAYSLDGKRASSTRH